MPVSGSDVRFWGKPDSGWAKSDFCSYPLQTSQSDQHPGKSDEMAFRLSKADIGATSDERSNARQDDLDLRELARL
jgi:hypothetical protein